MKELLIIDNEYPMVHAILLYDVKEMFKWLQLQKCNAMFLGITTTPLSLFFSLSTDTDLFMTSYIKFTPISGAKNENPLCYLLEIDEVKILLDCGWSDTFNTDDLVNLKK